ncbi:hypothetical protein LCGC14_2113990 [marine sediment metagenome]|uniref:Uncharacterized protein n=1 Tax=marine sediment metagenome TaxID=412755 RepID=A0A0F9ETC7_9ZZZZ
MYDYLRRAGLILLLMAVMVLSIAYVKERKEPIVKLVPVSDLSYIPSPREIQQRDSKTLTTHDTTLARWMVSLGRTQ